MSKDEKGRGCCFYGCVLMVVVFLLILGAAGYMFWQAKQYAYGHTSDQPRAFSKPALSDEQWAESKQKLEEFLATVEEGKNAIDIVLTADEINGLIWNDEKFSELKNKVMISLKDDMIRGEVSYPLDGIPLMGGRYFNGSTVLNVSCTEGELVITPESLEVRGQPVPDVAMDEIRKINFAEDAQNDPELGEAVKRIKRIEVKDEKLYIEIMPAQ